MRALSCPTLCDPTDSSPSGSSVQAIFLAIILEWVTISSSKESSQPKDRTCVSCIGSDSLPRSYKPSPKKPNQIKTIHFLGTCECLKRRTTPVSHFEEWGCLHKADGCQELAHALGTHWLFDLTQPHGAGVMITPTRWTRSWGTELSAVLPGPASTSVCLLLPLGSLWTLPHAALLSPTGNFLERLAKVHLRPGTRDITHS